MICLISVVAIQHRTSSVLSPRSLPIPNDLLSNHHPNSCRRELTTLRKPNLQHLNTLPRALLNNPYPRLLIPQKALHLQNPRPSPQFPKAQIKRTHNPGTGHTPTFATPRFPLALPVPLFPLLLFGTQVKRDSSAAVRAAQQADHEPEFAIFFKELRGLGERVPGP